MADAQLVLFSLVECAVGAVAAGVAALGWRHRDKRTGRPLVVMAVGTSLYAFSNALLSFVTDPLWWRLLNNISYPIGAAIAVGSFFVVVEFTEQQWLRSRRVRAPLVGFVALDFLAAMTDPVHNRMITSQQSVQGVVVGTAGPLFWVHTIVSLGIVFVATGICLTTLVEATGIYRRQSQAVVGAFGVGIAGFVWQSIAPVHPAIDVATVGMLGWCGIILWGIFVADFLDIVPVGRYRVVESIDDPVITLDADDRVIDSNPAMRRLVDAPTEWQGTPVTALFAGYPELVERIESRVSEPVSLERNGATHHFDVTVSPISDGDAGSGTGGDAPVAHVVILRDVTARTNRQQELERSRTRYRSLFEHSPIVLWEEDLSETIRRARDLVDDAGDLASHLEANPATHRELLRAVDVIDVNTNAVEAYGASSKDELRARFDELLTDDAMATNRRLLERLLAGDRRFRAETVYRTLDGDRRHELVDVFVPEPGDTDCSRVIVAGVDITDRKRYEARIETQNRWLERLTKVISHDLQTPLSTADNHLTLLDLELDDPPEPVAASLSDLQRTHERLREFTEHLPKLARESTDVDATVECDLAATAEDAWSVVEPDSLELVIEGDRTLRADPPRLRQVFENLFGNVAEHAADTATTVWVGTSEDGFYVADDGPGVAPEQAEDIFEYGMSTGDGSGVGLAIVRNIVEAHGWRITVRGREGGGAKFVVETTGTYTARPAVGK